MYPRNAASPEPIAIGAVVQITDGAVQSSGVTVRVKAAGQSEADGGGNTAYTTDGVVLYTPTQAETNYTSFVLIAKKTNCIPASVTVVTSASATTGYAGLDWAKLTGATTTVNLSGTTISTSQAVASVSGAVGSVTGAVASVTGNVGGNVVGSVGSISGVTFPANFASLGINSSGHVSRVVLVDTTTANTDMRGTDNALLAASYTAPLSTAGTAAAVWDALLATYATAGSFGARVVRSANSNNQLQITGSNHAAADVHEFQPDVLTDAAIDATAVTLLQAGLATAANQTTIIDRVTYGLTALVGACSDAQTAAETYTLTIGGSTFTVDYSGLDSSGNRSTTTLSKV